MWEGPAHRSTVPRQVDRSGLYKKASRAQCEWASKQCASMGSAPSFCLEFLSWLHIVMTHDLEVWGKLNLFFKWLLLTVFITAAENTLAQSDEMVKFLARQWVPSFRFQRWKVSKVDSVRWVDEGKWAGSKALHTGHWLLTFMEINAIKSHVNTTQKFKIRRISLSFCLSCHWRWKRRKQVFP